MRAFASANSARNANCRSRASLEAHPRELTAHKARQDVGFSRFTLGSHISTRPSHVSQPSSVRAHATSTFRSKAPKDVNVVVFGSTGYIGKKVTLEMIERGFNVVAVSREQSGIGGAQTLADVKSMFPGAATKTTDVTDVAAIERDVFNAPADVVVSCLASRTGGIEDSWAIDYKATKNCLDAAHKGGASHFILLSAICVQKPLLQFQKAKLKLEAELQACDDITHSIVRPTAFFKSLAGQVESVKKGGPYVMFGDGHLAACKPISEEDLSAFMADCVMQEEKVNKVLPIGGPGKAMDPQEQADVLFGLLGKEPKTLKVPVALMDGIIGFLDLLGGVAPNLKEAAEFGRIGKYYATESMLVMDADTGTYDADATPSYGKETLEMFFKRVLQEGLQGQELGDQAVFK